MLKCYRYYSVIIHLNCVVKKHTLGLILLKKSYWNKNAYQNTLCPIYNLIYFVSICLSFVDYKTFTSKKDGRTKSGKHSKNIS